MQKGRIDLSPSFQRRSAWTTATKSRFIESAILAYPIPQIVLAEKQDRPGHFLVIDGKQRLLALRQFMATQETDPDFEPYALIGLSLMSQLKGFDAQRLRTERPDLIDQFENHTIRTVAIRNWGVEDFLYSLFLRLNTGSVPLSPQELRQALVPGPFVDFVDYESGNSPGLRFLLGNAGPDRRMVDAEILVRYFGLLNSPIPYKGNLKEFLDDTCRHFNRTWASSEEQLRSELADLEEAIQTGVAVFGEDGVARKWAGHRFERALNRAVFDIEMYYLSTPELREASLQTGDDLKLAFVNLCTDDSDFLRTITTTTKSTAAIRGRFSTWGTAVSQITGIALDIPSCLQPEFSPR